jgi:hypothetical protein
MENSDEYRRIELTELYQTIRTGFTAIWGAFATFFTINALLVPAFGFLVKADPTTGFALWPAVAISFFGVFISVMAIFAVQRFTRGFDPLLERAKELEEEHEIRIFRILPTEKGDVNEPPEVQQGDEPIHGLSFAQLTKIICFVVAVLWAIAFIWVLSIDWGAAVLDDYFF